MLVRKWKRFVDKISSDKFAMVVSKCLQKIRAIEVSTVWMLDASPTDLWKVKGEGEEKISVTAPEFQAFTGELGTSDKLRE